MTGDWVNDSDRSARLETERSGCTKTFDLVLYVIDNAIDLRGQDYVYRRSLGLEPPAFYDWSER